MDEDYFLDYNSSADYNATMPDLIFLEHYILPPLVALVNIIGLFGNVALAFILRKTPASNAPHVCILNLAIADLLVLIFYLPFAISATFPFGIVICKLSETLSDVATGVSAFSLIALTGYSFFGREVASQTERSRKNVSAVVASIWALAIAFAVPTVAFAHLTNEAYEPFQYCVTYDPRFEQAEGPMRFIVYYALPLSSVGIFYCLAKRNVDGSIASDNSRLAISLVVVYAIAFFTENLAAFWVLLPTYEDEYWPLINFIGYHIGNLYRCLNPIVLYCVSGTFRSAFKEHVFCWCFSETREPVVDVSRNREAVLGAEILSQRLL